MDSWQQIVLQELAFKFIRSSGSGGQHVNKVSSKVELSFNLEASLAFNEKQRAQLLKKLKNRLTKESVLILQCDDSRSQHDNKALVINRFLELIQNALQVPKKRVSTKVPKAAIEKRLKGKRQLSDKKANRKPPELS
ncbi:alternative ribosome rescue aminoacyl-tRNA hydrolase ArfB [Aestuariivivens sediminis]|uniref:alternative ribosome rescue aminoacyl-tRNA hydrolase ArfB n=1 Tax=Aestuariivivens sediminis TaxID=2913557 RepID=UPI001F55E2B2